METSATTAGTVKTGGAGQRGSLIRTEVSGQPRTNAPAPKNLLVRGVNWLGDAVMTTPALLRVREYYPESRITLLTSEKLADLWLNHPGVDRTLTFSPEENPWSIGRRLRGEHFDAALVLPNSLRSALEVWRAGVPERIGYAGNGRSWFLTQPVTFPAHHPHQRRRSVREIKQLVGRSGLTNGSTAGPHYVHQTQDYLELVSVLGANPAPLPPRVQLGPEEMQLDAGQLLSSLGLGSGATAAGPTHSWLGLNPSAAYGSAKCWPVERFAQVTREICKAVPDTTWLCFGAAADRAICERIVELAGPGNRVINLAGKTTLRQLMVLLTKCWVLLTNDSGPMHVAAALGTPVVVPFGSTSPELTGPGQPGDPRHRPLRVPTACAPCFRRSCPIDFRCMTGITVERVVESMLECLSPRSAHKP